MDKASRTRRISRHAGLDALRGLGLIAVIVAHVHPPGLIFQLRNFDVPLMVLIAGWTFAYSSGASTSVTKYLRARAMRLLLPTWSFLTGLFAVQWMLSGLANSAYPYTVAEAVSSYLLIRGIGYVWIIRVLLSTALVAPFARSWVMQKSQGSVVALLLLVWACYELAVWASPVVLDGVGEILVQDVLLEPIGYGVVLVVGMLMPQLTRHRRFVIGGMLLAGFASAMVVLRLQTGEFILTQIYKYPPTSYYMSYALGVSFVLTAIMPAPESWPTRVFAPLEWLGRRTMWLYLWHIGWIEVLGGGLAEWGFPVAFPLVLGLSVACTWLQGWTVPRILQGVPSTSFKQLISTAFGT